MRVIAFLVLLLCIVFPAIGQPANPEADLQIEPDVGRKALAIGVRNYSNLNPVPSAEKDVHTIANKLRTVGFDVTESFDETGFEIWDRVREFSRSLQPDDVVVFYFSGHGFQFEGLSYLLPRDIAKEISSTDISVDALPLDGVLPYLKVRKPSFILMLIDTCRDNVATVKRPDGTEKGVGDGGLIQTRTLPPQLVFGLATSFGRVAFSSKNPNEN